MEPTNIRRGYTMADPELSFKGAGFVTPLTKAPHCITRGVQDVHSFRSLRKHQSNLQEHQ